jgi:hypothetical protein
LTEWWLDLIRERCVKFLENLGYDFKAVPENYIDEPPSSIIPVKKNFELIRKLLDRSVDRFQVNPVLIYPLKEEIYAKIETYLKKSQNILTEAFKDLRASQVFDLELIRSKTIDSSSHVRRRVEDLVKDVKYLLDMKQLEFDYFNPIINEDKKEMSQIVPITGLIVGRFHRLENELQTVIDLWDR